MGLPPRPLLIFPGPFLPLFFCFFCPFLRLSSFSPPANPPTPPAPQNRNRLARCGHPVFTVQTRDKSSADFSRTNGFAFVVVRAVAKTQLIHRTDHVMSAALSLRLALWHQAQVRDFSRNEKHLG